MRFPFFLGVLLTSLIFTIVFFGIIWLYEIFDKKNKIKKGKHSSYKTQFERNSNIGSTNDSSALGCGCLGGVLGLIVGIIIYVFFTSDILIISNDNIYEIKPYFLYYTDKSGHTHDLKYKQTYIANESNRNIKVSAHIYLVGTNDSRVANGVKIPDPTIIRTNTIIERELPRFIFENPSESVHRYYKKGRGLGLGKLYTFEWSLDYE